MPDGQAGSRLNDLSPMVLRRVPIGRRQLAESMIETSRPPQAGTWWELVDPAIGPDLCANAVALLEDRHGDRVTISVIAVVEAADPQIYSELLGGLIAALRSLDVDTVLVHTADTAAIGALLEIGFTMTDDSEDQYVMTL